MLWLVNNTRNVGLVVAAACLIALCWDTARLRRQDGNRSRTIRPWIWNALLLWFALLPITFRVPGNTLFEQATASIGSSITEHTGSEGGDTNASAQSPVVDALPSTVSDYITANYSGISVVDTEVNDGSYEVSLSDGRYLVFDSAGTFVSEHTFAEALAAAEGATGLPGEGASGEESAGGEGGSEGFFAPHGYKPSLTLPVHIATGSAMSLVGPFLVNRSLRNRFRRGHRVLGRVFIASGIVAGLLGTAMAIVGPLTRFDRWMTGTMGVWLAVSCGLSLYFIRKRQVSRHREWTIRAFAASLTIASHRLYVLVPAGWQFLPSRPGDGSDFYLSVITLATGELIVRQPWAKRSKPRAPKARVAPASA